MLTVGMHNLWSETERKKKTIVRIEEGIMTYVVWTVNCFLKEKQMKFGWYEWYNNF